MTTTPCGTSWCCPLRPKKSLYTVDAQGKQVLRTTEVFGRREDIVAANKLAALIYFTCQGYVFFQAGEEFGRTKLGDDNSYRSAPGAEYAPLGPDAGIFRFAGVL